MAIIQFRVLKNAEREPAANPRGNANTEELQLIQVHRSNLPIKGTWQILLCMSLWSNSCWFCLLLILKLQSTCRRKSHILISESQPDSFFYPLWCQPFQSQRRNQQTLTYLRLLFPPWGSISTAQFCVYPRPNHRPGNGRSGKPSASGGAWLVSNQPHSFLRIH